MNTRPLMLAAYMCAVFPLYGCSEGAAPVEAPAMLSVPTPSARPAGETQPEDTQQDQWTARKLVRRGSLELEVKSVEDAIQQIQSMADRYAALLSDARVVQDDEGNRQATLTLRVPTDSFRAAVDALKGLGTTKRETVSTDDVTKAYFDIETRLAVLQETEERLRRLLSTRTGNLADVLAVERELGRVRGEIEGLEGQRRYYDQLIALSTIDIAMYEPEALLRPGALAPIGEAFRESVGIFSSSLGALIRLVVLIVPWVLVAVLAWLVIRRVRRAEKTPGEA